MRIITVLAVAVLLLSVSRASSVAAPPPATAAVTAAAAAPVAFRVTKVGKGQPMILIPGLMSSGDVWTATVDRFKDRYECHVLTLAGFAGQPGIAPPLLDTVRLEVIRYIKDQRLTRPIIVGHSLGGFLAFWIAATAPDSVGAVVAVDGVPYLSALMNPSVTPDGVKGQADQMRQLYATFTAEQLRAQSRLSLGKMMKMPADIERALTWVGTSEPRTVGEAMYEMMVTDLRDQVAAIEAPVLLLAAADFAKDDVTRAQVKAAYEAQVAKVPRHTVILVPEARHFIMLDAPQALWSSMDSFLAHGAGAPAAAGAGR